VSASTGIVLAGAAALGAYEAGVLRHVLDDVARDVGRVRVFDIVSGTSAGAINAAAIAAFADRPAWGAARMCEAWTGLRLGHVLRPSAVELLRSALETTELSSRLSRALRLGRARGGLLDPRPLATLLGAALPIERIETHLASGILRGIAISATHVATGRAAVFYRSARPLPRWEAYGTVAVPTRLSLAHAMASAAIPLLLPPVTVEGDLYCDGGLRQLVPLAPSIHLGAQRLLVINPLAPAGNRVDEQARREATTSPLYLAGKALNALFVDRTEVDLARLDQVTAILQAGRRRYGPAFEADINAELAGAGQAALHEVAALRIGPSADLGKLAVEYATSGELARRERGIVAWVMRRLAEAGTTRSGDLLSYLLFDGGFAAELIARGRADARRRHDELCAFFAEVPRASSGVAV
jgi:NTE family protein